MESSSTEQISTKTGDAKGGGDTTTTKQQWKRMKALPPPLAILLADVSPPLILSISKANGRNRAEYIRFLEEMFGHAYDGMGG